MTTDLFSALEQVPLCSKNEFEESEYFECLGEAFLENDEMQSQFHNRSWHFRDWAMERGQPEKDVRTDQFVELADCQITAPPEASSTDSLETLDVVEKLPPLDID